MSQRGVPVFNAPGRQRQRGEGAGARRDAARRAQPRARGRATCRRSRPARDFEKRVEDGKKQFAGFELPGRTLGVIGLGAIGGLVADTAIKLGMKVMGYDPDITVDNAWRLPVVGEARGLDRGGAEGLRLRDAARAAERRRRAT